MTTGSNPVDTNENTDINTRTVDSSVRVKQDGIWVFGYGSLIWKPPIHYESKVGHDNESNSIQQHSEDHRGTPEKPGRVVTLIPSHEWVTIEDTHGHNDMTWGVAFKIPSDDVETTRAYLDHREKNGYTVHTVHVYTAANDKEPIVRDALVYIGTTNNEAYVGPAPMEAIAKQIHESYGPSGWNAEYLLNLAEALREISPDARDDHVFELERLVRQLIDVNSATES
ncbi:hypothetical protein DFQ30_001117 [Apophysomyces sp. BC1015]|nr:hypothetical protein DFQ30_001117 [Apophysomyces sp. BC1015]